MRDLGTWNDQALAAFDDCKEVFERVYDLLEKLPVYRRGERRFLSSDALGFWLVSRLTGRDPKSEQELALMRALGGMTTVMFSNWWQA